MLVFGAALTGLGVVRATSSDDNQTRPASTAGEVQIGEALDSADIETAQQQCSDQLSRRLKVVSSTPAYESDGALVGLALTVDVDDPLSGEVALPSLREGYRCWLALA